MSEHCESLSIPPVKAVTLRQYGDERGFFMERFKETAWREWGIEFCVKQINHSRSARGVLRGLHYQIAPQPQAKIVMALSGEIFDVAVDLRRGSPWFGKWVGRILSGKNRCCLFVPRGFAHGFCVMSETADVLYYCDAEYAPQQERGVRWDDPSLGISWPVAAPVLSAKDAVLPLLDDAEYTFEYR